MGGYLFKGGIRLYRCPVGLIDWDLWNDAYFAYDILFEAHQTTQGKGLDEETEFFVEAARLVKKKLKEKELADMEKASKIKDKR